MFGFFSRGSCINTESKLAGDETNLVFASRGVDGYLPEETGTTEKNTIHYVEVDCYLLQVGEVAV
jgi:hypothetical protein